MPVDFKVAVDLFINIFLIVQKEQILVECVCTLDLSNLRVYVQLQSVQANLLQH